MTSFRVALIVSLLVPAVANGQTANGSPTSPAPPGLVGTPRPVSRTAPSVGGQRANPALPSSVGSAQPPPKPTAAELAEKRQLDHDLKICIGC